MAAIRYRPRKPRSPRKRCWTTRKNSTAGSVSITAPAISSGQSVGSSCCSWRKPQRQRVEVLVAQVQQRADEVAPVEDEGEHRDRDGGGHGVGHGDAPPHRERPGPIEVGHLEDAGLGPPEGPVVEQHEQRARAGQRRHHQGQQGVGQPYPAEEQEAGQPQRRDRHQQQGHREHHQPRPRATLQQGHGEAGHGRGEDGQRAPPAATTASELSR